MAEMSNMEFWRTIMGDSDDDDGEVFEGFTLEEINKREESDVDLDLVVNTDEFNAVASSGSDESETISDPEESDSDILPPIAGPSRRKRKRKQPKKKNEVTVDWKKELSTVKPEKDFDVGPEHVGPCHDLPADATEYDFFSIFLPEEFWENAVSQTNLYAVQCQENHGEDKYWSEVSISEMKLFIFIQFMFGIHHLPDTSMYWSSDPLLRVPAIADVMSRNRFQKISQYFHLNDNSKAVRKGEPGYDPLFKVRPLLDLVRTKSHTHFKPGRDISIDEAMIKFNGRLSFKQYIKGKPNPWGIKVWCAADPRTGYMLDFDVYQGRSATPIPNGLGYHVVMDLASPFLDVGHHLFYDNYFSSVKLAQDLLQRNTYMCSTIRVNRVGWPKDLGTAAVKTMKAGDVSFRQDGNMVATLWKDKRPVAVLSTNAQPAMGKEERRAPGGKKEVSVPQPVQVYNKSMGGVDLADQLASYYPVGRPSVRWWRYICWWLMQTAMINAYIIFRQTKQPAPKRGYRHIDFRLNVLRALSCGKVSRKRATEEGVSQAGVADANPLAHKLVRVPGRKKNCKLCQKKKIRTATGRGVETVFGCVICCVHLCKESCFAEFHQRLAQSINE